MSELTVFIRHAKRNRSTQVDLSRRELAFIPKQVLSIRSIEVLNLSDNKIELYKLKNLNLNNNCLTELPEEITSLPYLQVLKVSENPLKPKFEALLLAQNQKNPKLAQCLKVCFQKQKTPTWLSQQPTLKSKNKSEFAWEQNQFKVQDTFAKTASHGNRRQNQKYLKEKQKDKDQQNECKNGILQIKMSDLVIGQQISMGGFSTIHKGQYHGLDVAIKKVFNPNVNEQVMADFNTETAMLSKYRHPNIVLMLGAVTIPPTLCLVMEYFNQGTLYDALHKKKINISQKQKSHIARQIIKPIYYLHKHGIVHRDIKSHNILLTNSFDIKLCDFGLAKHKSDLNTGPMQYSGTPTYMAQQLFLKKPYDLSVDIFALGTMFYELYSGKVPYFGLDPVDIKSKILDNSSLPMNMNIKSSVLEKINKCRAANPKQRPTIDELIDFEQW